MDVILWTLLAVGAVIEDALEGWVFALFLAVIAYDAFAGYHDRYVLYFTILQVIGLISGYLWATSVFFENDVNGPYAWLIVIGLWFTAVVIFHIFLVFRSLRARTKAE